MNGKQDTSSSRWRTITPERKRVIVWGAADQGRVDWHVLRSLGVEVVAYVDDTAGLAPPFAAVPLLQGWAALEPFLKTQDVSGLGFVLAIGNPFGHVRQKLHLELIQAGLAAVSFSDATALVCASATIGPGLQMMPLAIVHNDARIGRQCILNTRSLVEHDCVLEDGVEIGPGATLCGRVHVGMNTWIGAGAVVRPRIRIGKNSIVGAGAVVVADVPDNIVVAGTPARPLPGKTPPSASQGD